MSIWQFEAVARLIARFAGQGLLLFWLSAGLALAQTKPNIVFVLTDDLDNACSTPA